jgi:IS5 family transposase
LGQNHELYRLTALINWALLEQDFSALYSEHGRPGLPIRLMAGLCYLNHAFKTADEATVRHWLENPYHQYFCGQEYFCHELPIDPSSLSRFCKRIGEKKFELILQVTVQEKAIACPTDARLFNRSRQRFGSPCQETWCAAAAELQPPWPPGPDVGWPVFSRLPGETGTT